MSPLKRRREMRRLLTALAEQSNAHLLEIRTTNGGHVVARFDRGPLLFSASTSRSVSGDWNFEAQAKRALRLIFYSWRRLT
jgi:hypothetical protein